jgi:adenine-specific DNA-methyltransferase
VVSRQRLRRPHVLHPPGVLPDQSAWEKLAKALGDGADAEAFEAFKGTESLPFKPGRHRRIAVKAIDPRGNEVMTVRRLPV